MTGYYGSTFAKLVDSKNERYLLFLRRWSADLELELTGVCDIVLVFPQ